MKLIIDIPYEAYYAFKCALEKGDQNLNALGEIVANGIPYEEKPEYFPPCEDCNKKMEEIRQAYDKMKATEKPQGELISREELKEAIDKLFEHGGYDSGLVMNTIDNVPSVPLRLMTVEECAGHTIDYAMGWKACIEWIKKGGTE